MANSVEKSFPNMLRFIADWRKLIWAFWKLLKDLEHMIYGVLASYLKQLTGEPWVLFKDKVS